MLAHLGGVEIAVDRKHNVGGEVVALVELDQIGALNVIDIGVFNAPPIRGLSAVENGGKLPVENTVGVFIAASDAAADLLFFQVEPVLPKFGRREKIAKN